MTAIVGFCSVSPSSSSESANELGSESSENSCVSSGKDCVLYDESLESLATENKTPTSREKGTYSIPNKVFILCF